MLEALSKYLSKHNELTKSYKTSHSKVDIIVVIPVYNEFDIEKTIESLQKAHYPGLKAAVYFVINYKQGTDTSIVEQQMHTCNIIKEHKCEPLHFEIIEAFDLPKKHFGVGLARKIGMDCAIRHFNDTENTNGIIVSLDADCTVDSSYFKEINRFFKQTNNIACSIKFEHPICGREYNSDIYKAIIQYELHLRYYVEALKYLNVPYAFHTLGSCFAVRAIAYVKVGGMNRKQGGEEFYFIQKLLAYGKYANLNSTKVEPSPRSSQRVPFGTGPSVNNIIKSDKEYMSYNVDAFIGIKKLFDIKDMLFKADDKKINELCQQLPEYITSYLQKCEFYKELETINTNSASIKTFTQRFYSSFNGFWLVKYMNYIHEDEFARNPISKEATKLLILIDKDGEYKNNLELLESYRAIQNH